MLINNEIEINSARKSLGFSGEARKQFDFLETKWGFKCTQELPTFVRYESSNIYVNIYHGRVSFEVGVEFGEMSNTPFTLEMLVEILDEKLVGKYWAAHAKTVQEVCNALKKAADGLKLYGDSVLSGDRVIFDRLKQLGKKRVADMALDSLLHQIRPKAEAAFRQGDFEKTVDLYSSIENALTPVEKKKLEIAKKRINLSEKSTIR